MTQTWNLLFVSGICFFTLGSSDFHLIERRMSYREAQTYCRQKYTDLVTVHNWTVMNTLVTLVSPSTKGAWIGLEDGTEFSWKLSSPNEKLDFFNWMEGEPTNINETACSAINQKGKWFESDCGIERSFVCHGNSETNGPFFVAESKSWRDAQDHCRALSSDLISIHSAEENKAILDIAETQHIWTGLFKDSWKWSDGSSSSFRYWKPNQPNYRIGQDCVAAIFINEGKWNDRNCSRRLKFICYEARNSVQTSTQATLGTTVTAPLETVTREFTTNPSTLVSSTSISTAPTITTNLATTTKLTTPKTPLVISSTSRTESSTTSHSTAPTITTNLATTTRLTTPKTPLVISSTSRTESSTSSHSTAPTITTNLATTTRLTTPKTPLLISSTSRTESSTTSHSTAPTITTNQATTTRSTTPQTPLLILSTPITEPNTTSHSTAPTITTNQATTTRSTTPQTPLLILSTPITEPNTTSHSTAPTITNNQATTTRLTTPQTPLLISSTPRTESSTTSHSTAPTITTNQATTTRLTTPQTPLLISSTSRTELNTKMTQISTVTKPQQPPSATAQVITDGVSILTSPMAPDENNLPGNLILIPENMTWIEAMAYCRMHHVDLVHITTKYIQEKVAEKAKNATSSHVWLGLRYTCNFNFWFWTSSATVCYLNWAPGQGPEGKYECGVTGAIEATGRQQWVGLNETEKLNFICYACTG